MQRFCSSLLTQPILILFVQDQARQPYNKFQ